MYILYRSSPRNGASHPADPQRQVETQGHVRAPKFQVLWQGMYLMAALSTYENGSKKHGCAHGVQECRRGHLSNVVTNLGSCGAMSDFELLEIDENDNSFPWGLIHHNELAHMLNNGLGKVSFL